MALHTASCKRITLVFVPPAPGCFDLRLALPEAPQQAVRLRIGATTTGTEWLPDWFQLCAAQPVFVPADGTAVFVEMWHGEGNAPLDLMIKGAELDYLVRPGPTSPMSAPGFMRT